MKDQPAAQSKPADIWFGLIFGLLLVGFAWYMYGDLTEFEAVGGERKMNAVFAALYNLLGKWGVVVPLAVGGLALCVTNARKLARLRQG